MSNNIDKKCKRFAANDVIYVDEEVYECFKKNPKGVHIQMPYYTGITVKVIGWRRAYIKEKIFDLCRKILKVQRPSER